VDPWFIVSAAPDEARLIRTARDVNDSKPEWVINKVKAALAVHMEANPDKCAEDVTIACFGLTFKPDIDDMRESPALWITRNIAKIHAGPVWAAEPHIDALPASMSDLITLKTADEALEKADILLLLVDHKEFRMPRANLLSKKAVVIDTRGVWR
jgi:UDP-N-acetyl-D-mannosaminuronic acid dehydrogenase